MRVGYRLGTTSRLETLGRPVRVAARHARCLPTPVLVIARRVPVVVASTSAARVAPESRFRAGCRRFVSAGCLRRQRGQDCRAPARGAARTVQTSVRTPPLPALGSSRVRTDSNRPPSLASFICRQDGHAYELTLPFTPATAQRARPWPCRSAGSRAGAGPCRARADSSARTSRQMSPCDATLTTCPVAQTPCASAGGCAAAHLGPRRLSPRGSRSPSAERALRRSAAPYGVRMNARMKRAERGARSSPRVSA